MYVYNTRHNITKTLDLGVHVLSSRESYPSVSQVRYLDTEVDAEEMYCKPPLSDL